jgi:tryptophanyl-tRNA synthetase
MSKSYDNAVFLSDDDETVRKKFSNAITDPQRQRRTDPGRPEVCNIFAYHRLYTPGFRQHEIDHLCRTAGIGCVECKRELIDNFFTFFAPIRTKRAELARRLPYVREVLDRGGQRAREVAEETMTVVREAMKLGWRI